MSLVCFSNEPRPVVRLYEVNLERVLVLGELLQVAPRQLTLDIVLASGVYQRHAGALEARAGETTAVNARQRTHYLVDGDKLRRAALVVVDAALAAVEAEAPEQLQVAALPSRNALAHTPVLRIEVLGTQCKPTRHGYAGLLKSRLRDVSKEGLIERLQRLVSVRKHVPRSRLALVDAKVVVAVDEAARKAREEYAYLKVGHGRIAPYYAVLVAVAVEKQQAVLAPKGDARLVEYAVVESYVLALGLGRYRHHLERRQLYVVGLGEGHRVSYQNGGARRQSADGQRALHDARDAATQREALLQGVLDAAGVVAPVALPNLRGLRKVEVNRAVERHRLKMHVSVVVGREPEVDALVYRKASHKAVLVVYVRAYRAHTVRREYVILVFHY